jgi:hypothetical protein
MDDQLINDESELDTNYFHISPVSPREALQPVIDMYRGLHYINRPLTGDSNFLLVTEQVGERPPDDPTGAQRQSFESSRKIWQAERGLEAIYLDCGWDVNAVEQTNFRRDEFLQKRHDHIKNVVEPPERDSPRGGTDLTSTTISPCAVGDGAISRLHQPPHRATAPI